MNIELWISDNYNISCYKLLLSSYWRKEFVTA